MVETQSAGPRSAADQLTALAKSRVWLAGLCRIAERPGISEVRRRTLRSVARAQAVIVWRREQLFAEAQAAAAGRPYQFELPLFLPRMLDRPTTLQ